jgi:proline iminopeptidase
MRERYPQVESFADGMLDVGDGNQIYWETSGNPDGKPVVMLHGGPGQGTVPGMRRGYDPDRYLIVLHDQRGTRAGLRRAAPGAGHRDRAHRGHDRPPQRDRLALPSRRHVLPRGV